LGKVVLLGPQGLVPDVGSVLAELGIRGKVALVRAGYQEREADDADTIATFGVPAVNLKLHARSLEVFKEDTEFTAAYQARQQRLRHLQAFYRVRLEKIEDAAKTISVRHVPFELLEQEENVSIDQLRHIDAEHVERCNELRRQFRAKWDYADRPLIAKHRVEIKNEMDSCEALVIAGGHVASLLNRLSLMNVLEIAGGKPVIAWSAGAMVLSDRIVLFHDYPPYGSDIAQVLDAGFGIAPGLVVLPDPRRRVNLDARMGIQRFARRMAPAMAVAMNVGARIDFVNGRITRANAMHLTPTGDIDKAWDGSNRRMSSPFLRGVPL